jgi:UDP-N-acetylmuramoylalanine-D-glutamate ligase
VLLVGGADRGVDYTPLVTYLESRAAGMSVVVLAMGAAGRRVAASLDAVETQVCDDVSEAVRVGANVLPAAHDGVRASGSERAGGDRGVVLFSPAAASPADYGSYQHRSRAFRTGVERLQQVSA